MPQKNAADNDSRSKGKVKASKNQMWKRGYRSKGPSKSMKIRANGFLMGGMLLVATLLVGNLFRIMIIQHVCRKGAI